MKDYLATYLKETEYGESVPAANDFGDETNEELPKLTKPSEATPDMSFGSFVTSPRGDVEKTPICPKCSGEIQRDVTPTWINEYCRADFRHFIVCKELKRDDS